MSYRWARHWHGTSCREGSKDNCGASKQLAAQQAFSSGGDERDHAKPVLKRTAGFFCLPITHSLALSPPTSKVVETAPFHILTTPLHILTAPLGAYGMTRKADMSNSPMVRRSTAFSRIFMSGLV